MHSTVTLGHVGNRAIVFALERLGLEAWPITTVSLAAHPGHGRLAGRTAGAAEVRALVSGLATLGCLARCRAVLSGYLGTVAVAEATLDAIAAARRHRPDVLYVLDPIMGDEAEGIYVAPELPGFFRERALAHADIALPNAFELGLLAGIAVNGLDSALAAMRTLVERGLKVAVATSVALADGQIGTLIATVDGAWLVATPRLDRVAKGAGDLLAALFLAHYMGRADAAAAAAAAVSGVFGVLARTPAASKDLDLVGAQSEIVSPSRHFAPEPLM